MKKLAIIIIMISFSGCIYQGCEKKGIEATLKMMPEDTKKKWFESRKSYFDDPSLSDVLKKLGTTNFEYFYAQFKPDSTVYMGVKNRQIIKVDNDFFIVERLPLDEEINYNLRDLTEKYGEKKRNHTLRYKLSPIFYSFVEVKEGNKYLVNIDDFKVKSLNDLQPKKKIND